MIASLVARLNEHVRPLAESAEQLSQHPAIEVGKLIESRLPLIVEAGTKRQMEEIHRWIQSLPGVDLLEVVYVHFESFDSVEPV